MLRHVKNDLRVLFEPPGTREARPEVSFVSLFCFDRTTNHREANMIVGQLAFLIAAIFTGAANSSRERRKHFPARRILATWRRGVNAAATLGLHEQCFVTALRAEQSALTAWPQRDGQAMSETRDAPPADLGTEDGLQKAALAAIVRGEEPGDILQTLQAYVGEEKARLIIDRAYEEYDALQQSGRLRELERASPRKKTFRMSARGYSGALMLLAALLTYLNVRPGGSYRDPIVLVVLGLVLLATVGMRQL
jgi:hypothetical protein